MLCYADIASQKAGYAWLLLHFLGECHGNWLMQAGVLGLESTHVSGAIASTRPLPLPLPLSYVS